MELGKTAYLILGMLRKGARTGYDIKSKADVSSRFFWTISYGQIYPELKRLEKAGLVTGETEASGGRQRRAYELTPAGVQALHDWLASPGPLTFELRHEGVLRLFFADALAPGERLALIATIRAEHERMHAELAQIHPLAEQRAAELGDPMPLLTLETGIAYHSFFVGLCDRLERRLSETGTVTGGK